MDCFLFETNDSEVPFTNTTITTILLRIGNLNIKTKMHDFTPLLELHSDRIHSLYNNMNNKNNSNN